MRVAERSCSEREGSDRGGYVTGKGNRGEAERAVGTGDRESRAE